MANEEVEGYIVFINDTVRNEILEERQFDDGDESSMDNFIIKHLAVAPRRRVAEVVPWGWGIDEDEEVITDDMVAIKPHYLKLSKVRGRNKYELKWAGRSDWQF